MRPAGGPVRGVAAGVPAGCPSTPAGPAVGSQVATCQPFRLLPDRWNQSRLVVGMSEPPYRLTFDSSRVTPPLLPVMLVGGAFTCLDGVDNGTPQG